MTLCRHSLSFGGQSGERRGELVQKLRSIAPPSLSQVIYHLEDRVVRDGGELDTERTVDSSPPCITVILSQVVYHLEDRVVRDGGELDTERTVDSSPPFIAVNLSQVSKYHYHLEDRVVRDGESQVQKLRSIAPLSLYNSHLVTSG
ncbi:hypothetical protein J6590_010934 [Homalodisca vitripennis]|nr:hypothetical protein J6590_010934 [Homalodisca vitripennis]